MTQPGSAGPGASPNAMGLCSRWVFGRRVGSATMQRMCNFRATSQLIGRLLRNSYATFGLKRGCTSCNPPAPATATFPIVRSGQRDFRNRGRANSSPRWSAAFRRMKSCRRSPRDRQSGMDCADSDAAGCSPRHREGDQPSYLARVFPLGLKQHGTQCCHAADRRSAQIRVADHLRRRSHGSSSIRRDFKVFIALRLMHIACC